MVGNVVEGVWRIFDEGSEVKRGVEMVENGEGTETASSATGRSGADWVTSKEKWEEREMETREDFGDLWCLGLVNAENGKV